MSKKKCIKMILLIVSSLEVEFQHEYAFEAGSKIVIPIHDIKTPQPITKTISNEINKTKYLGMEIFDTFYDDYIDYKYYLNDIESVIRHSNDINSQNEIND